MKQLHKLEEFVIFTFKYHWRNLAVFSLGIILYDIIARIFLILANALPLQSKVFNFTLDENINNLFLFIDICLIFFVLYFVTSPEPEEPRNRHWYE